MKSNLLKAKLVERGMSVDQLASLLGKNRSTVYRMLNNPERITIGDAKRIKAILNLTNEEAVIIFLV